MRRLSLLVLSTLLMLAGSGLAQQAVPTLVPPTPVPREPTPVMDSLPSESAVARIQQTGRVRVGVLYNEPPFVELTMRGEVSGYEAEIARRMADAWGVELDFVQVTRQNALPMLKRGEVDMLAAAMVHHRALDNEVEFSQTYHTGRQALLVPAEAEIASIYNTGNARVGYVVGTPSEAALNAFIADSGLPLQRQPYLTLDRAYAALYGDEVDAVAGRREHLLQIAQNELNAIKLLEQPLAPEPFAFALPRQDVNMRNLVNRTLQYLLSKRSNPNADSTLVQVYAEYLPGARFQYDALPVWENVGSEAPTPAQVAADMPIPQQYALPRVQSAGVLRVAGGQIAPEGAPRSVQRVTQINRAVAEQIGQRLGVSVQFVEGDPVALVENGQADIAVGLAPDWNLSNRIDFSQPYLKHGDRLLVPTNRNVRGFGDLRGAVIALIMGDDSAEDRANAWGRSVNVNSLRFFRTTEDDLAITLLENNNATVAFGDSLQLVPHQQASPGALEFLDRWYSRKYIAVGVPRNDPDFRAAIDYAIQDMAQDDTLDTLLRPVTPADETLIAPDIWPGRTTIPGLSG